MPTSIETDIVALLSDTGLVARIVLVALVVFSTWSWGIIIHKSVVFARLSRQSKRFWKSFSGKHSLREARAATISQRDSIFVPILLRGIEALESSSDSAGGVSAGTGTAIRFATMERAMHRTAAQQLSRLERHLTFLATTAAVAPFVGLFGTVWGVLTAFMGLGDTGMTTIQAVAPGIAEALITTAFGLLTAIPAVMAYNHFLHHIRLVGGELDDLKAEVMLMAESGRV
ncbi:MAG: MotA/TolQ/ExbB proton channel family protein [Gemmatimonadota bacterium]|jgi:biopolymer transport protein TolQ|nr:MotA/TolQ/ExbB proton channel family protein [Gemmatimonadota bacterium]